MQKTWVNIAFIVNDKFNVILSDVILVASRRNRKLGWLVVEEAFKVVLLQRRKTAARKHENLVLSCSGLIRVDLVELILEPDCIYLLVS